MTKQELIAIITAKVKLIRTEANYTQDKMADILGLSKKTLVQIEKGRIDAGWTTTVAISALFRHSSILVNALGDDPLVLIETISHDSYHRPKVKTMGGMLWWTEVKQEGTFRLQQNLISKHYRILDEEHYRHYSSFHYEESVNRLHELSTGDNVNA
jgi:DNA-binding XRE family transcriptional regulator